MCQSNNGKINDMLFFSDLCPERPAFYSNRAACLFKMGQIGQALEDAKTSVRLDPIYVKGHLR